MNKKFKYQEEYENSELFWKPEPAKYVRLLSEQVIESFEGLKILDIGAGEGKNAVFLANLGAKVTAVDLSEVALSRFNKQPNYNEASENISRVNDDILNFPIEDDSWDIIVAYGILHCLNSVDKIDDYLSKIQRAIKTGGYFVAVTFTDDIPIPDFQNYLDDESLIPSDFIQNKFTDWDIVFQENDIITETHPTSDIEHEHSLVRVIIRKK